MTFEDEEEVDSLLLFLSSPKSCHICHADLTIWTKCKCRRLLAGRGGQSALRFARLRMEKRHNYVRKVAEVAVTLFISNERPNIAGLVMAGSADFKTELSQSDMFDPVGSYLCDKLRAASNRASIQVWCQMQASF